MNSDIAITIIVGTLILMLLASFTITVLMAYQKRYYSVRDSMLAHETWGVRTIFSGLITCNRGFSERIGSTVYTSIPAPAIRSSLKALARSASLMIPPYQHSVE